MKITIEPSNQNFPAATVTVDLRHDEEGSSDAVETILNALVMYGHSISNVIEGAEAYAATQRNIQTLTANEDTNP